MVLGVVNGMGYFFVGIKFIIYIINFKKNLICKFIKEFSLLNIKVILCLKYVFYKLLLVYFIFLLEDIKVYII